jgi:hypothetical protein
MRFWRRVRGMLVQAVLWGAVWGLLGSVVVAGVIAMDTRVVKGAPLALAGIFAFFALTGAVSGLLFSLVFMTAERQQPLEALSLPRMALWGSLGGVLIPGALQLLLKLPPAPYLAVFGVGGALGAACATVTLALARRAPALPTPDESRAYLS